MTYRNIGITVLLQSVLMVPAVAGLEAYVTWGDVQWDPISEEGRIDVMWQSDRTLAGFQFDMSADSTLISVDPLECDEGWSLYAMNGLVLGFALQTNAHIDPSDVPVGLVTVHFEASYGTPLEFIDPIFATPDAQEIDINANDIYYVGLSACPGDVYPPGEGNAVVDVNDVLAILGDWGVVGSEYDVNGDTVVDVSDVLECLNYWGVCD